MQVLTSDESVLINSDVVVKLDKNQVNGYLSFTNKSSGIVDVRIGIDFSLNYEDDLEKNIKEIVDYCSSNKFDSISFDLGSNKKDLFFLINTIFDSTADFAKRKNVSIYSKKINSTPKYLDEFNSSDMGVDVVSFNDKFELFDRRLKKDLTCRDYLRQLINERGYKDVDVYKRAEVSKGTFSKIMNYAKNHNPKRETVAQLALGLKLSLEEAQKLYNSAGYYLGTSTFLDRVIIFFLTEKIYDIFEVNELLLYYGYQGLGDAAYNVSL